MPKSLVNLETFAIYLLAMFWAILEKMLGHFLFRHLAALFTT